MEYVIVMELRIVKGDLKIQQALWKCSRVYFTHLLDKGTVEIYESLPPLEVVYEIKEWLWTNRVYVLDMPNGDSFVISWDVQTVRVDIDELIKVAMKERFSNESN